MSAGALGVVLSKLAASALSNGNETFADDDQAQIIGDIQRIMKATGEIIADSLSIDGQIQSFGYETSAHSFVTKVFRFSRLQAVSVEVDSALLSIPSSSSGDDASVAVVEEMSHVFHPYARHTVAPESDSVMNRTTTSAWCRRSSSSSRPIGRSPMSSLCWIWMAGRP